MLLVGLACFTSVGAGATPAFRPLRVSYFQEVLIGSKTCDVTDSAYGAKGDGKADDAKHLQALLEDQSCSEVLLRGGTFLSSALEVLASRAACLRTRRISSASAVRIDVEPALGMQR